MRSVAIWAVVLLAVTTPLAAAAFSPLLQYRQPVYIVAGFAGIAAMCILLLQPLLAQHRLPGFSPVGSRRVHRYLGLLIIALVLLHVVGLWITSPPDVIDVLLFRSPTPFSIWGALAMWAIFFSGVIAFARPRLRLSPRSWRRLHLVLALLIVTTTAAHALLIDGTMETISKYALSVLVVGLTLPLALATFVRHRRR